MTTGADEGGADEGGLSSGTSWPNPTFEIAGSATTRRGPSSQPTRRPTATHDNTTGRLARGIFSAVPLGNQRDDVLLVATVPAMGLFPGVGQCAHRRAKALYYAGLVR